MNSQYRPFEYFMQDITHIYIGCYYTMQGILDAEEAPIRVKSLVRRYFLPLIGQQADIQLKDLLFMIPIDSECYDIMERLKTKVKCSIPNKGKSGYQNQVVAYTDFVRNEEWMSSRKQIYIEEICISKLALAGII